MLRSSARCFLATSSKKGSTSKGLKAASKAVKAKSESKEIKSQAKEAATTTTSTTNSTASTPNPPPVPPQTVQVFVNDKEVNVPAGSVIIQACAQAGIDIPRFCYHERLAIAGNCRMCLVQVEKMPKLVASCAQPVAAGMRISTDSPQVKKAREGVMEFLLANHPLDCAICDQGGECDLQDQAMAFGSDHSRHEEGKRAVEDKDFGPLIKTSMNRCIHCTRCVRFANEIGGLPQLGTTGRGNDMQIGTYIGGLLGSELSSNVIDLCPVGALTSRPYAFTARPWELRMTESVDVLDAVGSAIRVDTRGVELMRIQPRNNEAVNEEWISDKSRFVSDGLKMQRLTRPLILGKEASWSAALSEAAELIQEPSTVAIAGPFADVESCVAVADLLQNKSENLLLAPSRFEKLSVPSRPVPVHNLEAGMTLEQLEDVDALLVVATNLRHDAPLLNARLRKAFLRNGNFRAAVVGCDSAEAELNFHFDWLGRGIDDLKAVKASPFWKEAFLQAQRPAIVVSEALLSEHPDAEHILKEISNLALASKQASVCVVPRAASHVGAKIVGWRGGVANEASVALKNAKTVLMIGSPDAVQPAELEGKRVIYIGHHADRGALLADVVLPSAAYTEKSATFVNLEGRVQRTQAALAPPGDAREDWQIIRALSEVAGRRLAYDTVDELNATRPVFAHVNQVLGNESLRSELERLAHLPIKSSTTTKLPFSEVAIKDFYLTDVISRASATMAKCSLAFTNKISESTEDIDAAVKTLLQ